MSLKGELFIYDENRNLTAFESGHVGSTKSVIIIGGLGDGFMTIPYTAWLSQALSGLSISLIQVLLSSSYSAYGKESLSSDTQDLTLLLDYLCKKRGKQQIILLGHSTGCQDIMWLAGQNSNYLKLSELVQSCIRGAILQASVSDREYYFGPNGMAEAGELLEWAKKSSNTDVFLKLVGNVSFTAYRVKALLERLGDDDFFSTDMSVEERRSKAPKLHIPIALVFGGSDEYFPYPDRLPDLIASMREAWPEIFLAEIIEGADHGYTQEGRTRDALWRVLQTIFTKLFN